ncbi:class I SAM-dependent methyltransferase [Terrabacter sp. GCM10028922]|uniref:class I SAM-dependent methyltransferase n=1 Tax=Terrabacter sp. GCM10028922 TaxID=3273428 RepID=UPI0036155A7E
MRREDWDREAATFDHDPDHGLADPLVRAAWRELLVGVLPHPPARIVDLGCGTGTLTRLLVDEGHAVDGMDISPEMISRARAKVPEARFVVGDAARPAIEPQSYDVVLSRHVLWAMPEPAEAFARWAELLRPGGIAVLVEGRWATGAGLSAEATESIVRTACTEVDVVHLSDSMYWGRQIADERYLVVGRC